MKKPTYTFDVMLAFLSCGTETTPLAERSGAQEEQWEM